MTTENDTAWDSLSYEEKNRVLYERQKKMLDEFHIGSRHRDALSTTMMDEKDVRRRISSRRRERTRSRSQKGADAVIR